MRPVVAPILRLQTTSPTSGLLRPLGSSATRASGHSLSLWDASIRATFRRTPSPMSRFPDADRRPRRGRAPERRSGTPFLIFSSSAELACSSRSTSRASHAPQASRRRRNARADSRDPGLTSQAVMETTRPVYSYSVAQSFDVATEQHHRARPGTLARATSCTGRGRSISWRPETAKVVDKCATPAVLRLQARMEQSGTYATRVPVGSGLDHAVLRQFRRQGRAPRVLGSDDWPVVQPRRSERGESSPPTASASSPRRSSRGSRAGGEGAGARVT